MGRILITGASGFIGRAFAAELQSNNVAFETVGRQGFGGIALGGDTVVHLANVHGSVRENLRLASQMLRYVRDQRVDHLIVMQSFATLTGLCDFDPDHFNCGFRPRFVDGYAAGKLAVEAYLVSNRPPATRLTLVYLPAVLGEGGSWARFFAELGRYEQLRLPIVAAARANHIEVSEVARRLVSLVVRQVDTRSIQRLVWVSEASSRLGWAEFIRNSVTPTPEVDLYVPWLRFSENPLRHLLFAGALSTRLPAVFRAFLFRAKAGSIKQPGTSNAPARPSGVWEPGPFLRYLLCEQSYIPPVERR